MSSLLGHVRVCSGRVLGHWCRVIDVVDARGALERIGDLRENGGKYGDSIALTASGPQTKRPCYQKIVCAQFSAFEEQSMQEVAARKAGKHYLTRVSA